MSNAVIRIQNETSSNLSLDMKINEDIAIRSLLKAKGLAGDSVDVGDLASLDELNKNAQMQQLLGLGAVSLSVVGGTSDIAGSDAATAVPNADGLGGVETLVQAVPVGPGAAEDVTLIAAMPYAALVVDAQVLVSTAEATTWQLRDALAGGGNVLSDAFDVSATGRVRDSGTALAGVVASLSKGDPVVLRKAASATAVGTVILTLQRVS